MDKKVSKEKIKKEIIEWSICIVIAYVIYLFVNFFLGTVSGVKQISMYPTAVEGEKLLIARTVFDKKLPAYGDIITFIAPEKYFINPSEELIEGINATAIYSEHTGLDAFTFDFIGINKRSYIKRVIGLPGDHIEVKADGFVYRNNEKLIEPYLNDGTTSQNGKFINVIVPENSIFAMGDNRLNSMDSRAFGAIPMSQVDGRVLTRIWPLNKIGELK